MTDKQRIEELEAILAQFLQPIRNIPFPVVVKAMAGCSIIPVNVAADTDRRLNAALSATAAACKHLVDADPIIRNRPNEVGNDIEPFVMRAAEANGFVVSRPTSRSGVAKTTGYPDVLLHDTVGRPTYLECKVFGEGSAMSTMRSFYLSPSDEFKVHLEARHLLLAFGVQRRPIAGGINSEYRPVSYKLVDLHGLVCDVKYEFNSDNRRLYAEGIILAAGVL